MMFPLHLAVSKVEGNLLKVLPHLINVKKPQPVFNDTNSISWQRKLRNLNIDYNCFQITLVSSSLPGYMGKLLLKLGCDMQTHYTYTFRVSINNTANICSMSGTMWRVLIGIIHLILTTILGLYSCFKDEETEVQKGWVNSSGSQG